MPDSHPRKLPLPAVMNVATFHEKFGSDSACREHLKTLRWGRNLERVTCPACGQAGGWWLAARQLVECRECHRQTSVTAGTVFHRLRTPLWKWFWAVYQLAQDKKGLAALELAKQISVSYTTAGLMLHKLRQAMRDRNQGYWLKGLVEVDETYMGGEASGRRGRGAEKKTPVAVAVELDKAGQPGHVALPALPKVAGHSLRRFATRTILAGSTLHTDGWGSYRTVAKAGYQHRATVTGSGKRAVQKFPWLHTCVGNLKRMILGTYHSVSPKHLDAYLAEFSYRANRRTMEARLFERLMAAAITGKPMTYKQLVTGVS